MPAGGSDAGAGGKVSNDWGRSQKSGIIRYSQSGADIQGLEFCQMTQQKALTVRQGLVKSQAIQIAKGNGAQYLAAQTKALNNLLILLEVLAFQVIKELTAAIGHLNETAA